jgi:hypothetical protein
LIVAICAMSFLERLIDWREFGEFVRQAPTVTEARNSNV